jgi:signal transduction histidine kinase
VKSLLLRGRRPRIRRRLALIATVATGTVMLAFCVPLAFFVRSMAYDRAIDGAELQARSLAAELVSVHDAAAIGRIARQANSAAESQATVYLGSGHAVAGSPGAPRTIPRAVKAHPVDTPSPTGGRQVWEPVHHSAAQAVMVTVPPGELTKGVGRTWAFLFGAGALLVVFAVALADRLGRSIVRPLLALEDVTHKLRDGDLHCRHEPAGPYEVAEVGQAVNELADRINSLLASTRIAAGDLGHRLRTPLTAVRLDVEAVTDDAERAKLTASLNDLEAAVSRLIEETRQAPRSAIRRGDLAEAVRDRMAFWNVLAKSQQRQADIRVPARRVEVALDRDELDAAIDALLSNVFTHTPEKTPFSVQLRRTAPAGRSWSLIVEDQGTGAGGQKRDASKWGGTGLGLDIVRRTAELGGGTAEIERGKSGGYRVEIRLPERTESATANTADLDVPVSDTGQPQ